MSLYTQSGYVDIDWILRQGMAVNFVVGGRGTGKTYGALQHVIDKKIPFMFLRRTQAQHDIITSPEFNPFKVLNTDHGWSIGSAPITKYHSGYYNMVENDNGRMVPEGGVLGYSAALSTISNLRGFDASDVRLLLFDEFIPERHERPIKNEGAALLNAYETINRNRELSGKVPLQLLALANANDLGNPIFLELGLVSKAEQMRRKGQEVSLLRDRGIGLFILQQSPISEAKRQTALYKAAGSGDYASMALDNDFAELSSRSIKSQPLQEYTAVIGVGELTVYRHKSGRIYYVSAHRSGSCTCYGSSETELQRFRRAAGWLWAAYMDDNVLFEDSTCEILFTKYYK